MADTPTLPTSTGGLVALFRQATGAELDYGLSWYAGAHAWCADVAASHRISVDLVAGVTAALSPRCEWNLNKRRAVELIETGDTYGLQLGRGKAKRIMAGESPADVLGGPKTLAFYDCLSRPFTSDAVAIDRHAIDAAVGAVTSDKDRKLILGRKGGYERIADLYIAASRQLGLRPHVVQAVVWVVWRNRYGYFAGSDFTSPEATS